MENLKKFVEKGEGQLLTFQNYSQVYLIKKILDFFRKLFMSPINAEQSTNYLVKYVRTSIMECVIDFAYTFHCNINGANLCELLATSEYLCYSLLVDQCADFIKSILSVQNCIRLMSITRFLLLVIIYCFRTISSIFLLFFTLFIQFFYINRN